MPPVANGVCIRPLYEGQAEDLLRATLSAADHGVMVTDLQHRTLAVNARFGEMWGVDPRSVVESDVLEVRSMVEARIPDMAQWQANLETVYADPLRVQHDELALVGPAATVRRYTAPIFGPKGDVVGRLWTFADVSEEDRLLRLGTALEQVSLLHHNDPRIVYRELVASVGRFYGSLCLLSLAVEGFLEFRAVGAPPGHPAHDAPGNRVEDSFCQFCIRAAGPMVIQDARLDPEYASLVPATLGLTRYAGTPINAPDGRVIGTLCILDSHSEVPLNEDDLRFLGIVAMRIGSELERERQIEALRSNLVEAQALAVQNEKLAVTGTLAAATAHDIRNILSAVGLEMDMGQATPAETLAAVRRHIDRFAVLAHRLLSYARPGRLALTPVDIGESIERVLGLLGSHLAIARIEAVVEVEDGLPLVMADPGRLDHLFVNLVLNAIQAMKGGGRLTVTARRVDGAVTVDVADDGPGIAPEQMGRLFEPFSSSRADGFGLGLFSCRQIARECGGDVVADSEPGQGSRFRVTVPGL